MTSRAAGDPILVEAATLRCLQVWKVRLESQQNLMVMMSFSNCCVTTPASQSASSHWICVRDDVLLALPDRDPGIENSSQLTLEYGCLRQTCISLNGKKLKIRTSKKKKLCVFFMVSEIGSNIAMFYPTLDAINPFGLWTRPGVQLLEGQATKIILQRKGSGENLKLNPTLQ